MIFKATRLQFGHDGINFHRISEDQSIHCELKSEKRCNFRHLNEILNFTKKGENENDLVTMVGSVGGTLGIFIGFSKPKAPIDNQNR